MDRETHNEPFLGDEHARKKISDGPEIRHVKQAPLLTPDVESIYYKDVNLLRKFLSERGKIRSRGMTGLSVQQQRMVARAVKNAREMALLPYQGRERSGTT